MQRRRWGGGWKHTRQTLEKSPTSKLYTTWAHILSDRNVFALRGGRETAGSNAPGAFLVSLFFRGHLPQTSTRSKLYLQVIFVRLAFICQNFHERWCRKLLAIKWHKNPFGESKNEGTSEL